MNGDPEKADPGAFLGNTCGRLYLITCFRREGDRIAGMVRVFLLQDLLAKWIGKEFGLKGSFWE